MKKRKTSMNYTDALIENIVAESELKEGLSRNQMIAEIKRLGKFYKFDKFSDKQIYKIYQWALADTKKKEKAELAEIDDILKAPNEPETKRCEKCGTELTDKGDCPVCDLGDEKALEEKIEKHDELNPKLFNKDETLKAEVKEKVNLIVDEFLDSLAKDSIKFEVQDILLVGSNVNYNYTSKSDLDIHIITDTDHLHCPDNLYPALYSAYRSLFNKKFDIDFYGIPIELYVETEGTPRISSGLYSIKQDKWLKKPVKTEIPEIDEKKFKAELDKWEERYKKLVNKSEDKLDESKLNEVNLDWSRELKKLQDFEYSGKRNWGAMSLDKLLYDYDLAYSKNLSNSILAIERELRNRGLNNKIKASKQSTPAQSSTDKNKYSLENSLVLETLNEPNILEQIDPKISDDLICDNAYKYIGNKGTQRHLIVYILLGIILKRANLVKRACAYLDNFGWFKEDIEKEIKKDSQDVEIVKKLTELANQANTKKESLEEEIKTKQIDDINKFIEDIYELRKKGLAEHESEYSIGNLVFKTLRNKGYIDELKELKNQLKAKEMSLEENRKGD